MTEFERCRCITVDGHYFIEGRLGLDRRPSQGAKTQAAEYEKQVIAQLNEITRHSYTGSYVTYALTDTRKSVKIVPHELLDKREGPLGGKCQSGVEPEGWDERFYDRLGDPRQQSLYAIDKLKHAKYTTVFYSPSVWGEKSVCHDSHLAGQRPDEVLLHELVHALRDLQCRRDNMAYRGSGNVEFRYGNREEFLAILVTNIYMSEKKRGPLRGAWMLDPAGGNLLSGEAATSEGFLKSSWRLREVSVLYKEETQLFKGIGSADTSFNPIREYIDHPDKWSKPLVPDPL